MTEYPPPSIIEGWHCPKCARFQTSKFMAHAADGRWCPGVPVRNTYAVVLTAACSEMSAITNLQAKIHGYAVRAGWWDKKRDKGTLLCLIHSEISEAMEGERKDLMDDHLPHRKMAEVELADAVIRILDYAGGFGYDIAGAIQEKLVYNQTRADHKAEVREQANGKAF